MPVSDPVAMMALPGFECGKQACSFEMLLGKWRFGLPV